MKIDNLRKKYPKFVYEKFSYQHSKEKLKIFFSFYIKPDLYFTPKIIIKKIQNSQIEKIDKTILDNLIFQTGLMEIPSYWKATCSPEIEIQAGVLNKNQIKWWKNLIIKGMGQFFYENKIDFQKPNFLKIKSKFKPEPKNQERAKLVKLKDNKFLVPIGGGKDSIVTLEELKKQKKKVGCFLVNPTKTMRKIVRLAKIDDSIIVERKIDPFLLELNKKGFLNGHIPITALISFLSIIGALLFNYKNIAFSNEKSANEGNVRYLGKIVNHQWSKSSEFEKGFKEYCQKYLVKGVNYFSFLRKYSELEISKMFIKHPKYFSVFSSCNIVLAKKLKNRWCGNCPKCLFVYASLYPFLEKEKILTIFGQDIFENKKLLLIMKKLISPKMSKPFECVGTKKENQKIFKLSLKKAQKEGKIPYLLKKLSYLK